MAYLTQLSVLLLFLLAILVVLKERSGASIWLASGTLALALIQALDLLALRNPADPFFNARAVLCLESLLPGAFLLYGVSFRKKAFEEYAWVPPAVLLLIGVVFAAGALRLQLELLFLRSPAPAEGIRLLGAVGYWYYLALMILCVASLVNLEAVFASTHGANRWRVKYELFGAASFLGIFIVHFSQGLLYRSVNLSSLPLRSGVLVAAVLLIGYSRLFRGQSQKVAVSRYVFYRSFTLLAVGVYLLALGLFGQFARTFRLSPTRDFLLLLSFLSGLAFLILVFSEEIRRRVRVVAVKHFYAHKHDYREQWLGFSRSLAACRNLEEVRNVILEAYLSTFGLRSAALYVLAGGGNRFCLATAQGRSDLPASVALSPGMQGYFLTTGRVLNPLDGEYSPTAGERAFFTSSAAWLVVPLIAGERIEALALLGPQIAAEKPTFEDFDLMKILGRQAALSLGNFRLSEELAETREIAAVAKVSSFVLHDLKNLAYTFSLMMKNADEHIGEPEFQSDLVVSIRGTVAKMNALIAKLKAFPEKMELVRERVDLATVAGEVLDEVRALKKSIDFSADLAGAEANVDAQELKKVVLNLLLNACDAVNGQGTARVTTARRDDEVLLSVEDDGCGMSAAFVQNQLFKPFRTTKEKGLGIGLYQCRQIVEAHGGRIEVASREGGGTVFTVVLPGNGLGAG